MNFTATSRQGLGLGGTGNAGLVQDSVKRRLTDLMCRQYGVAAEDVVFQDGCVRAGAHRVSFDELVEQAYLLIEREGQLALLSLVRAERVLLRHWLLETWGQGLAAQPLLLPVSFKLPKNLIALAEEQERLLKRMGLELKSGGRDTMILTRVPALLRQTDLVRLLPELLQLIESGSDSDADQQAEVLCQWLVEQGISTEKIYDFSTASRLLTELVTDYGDQLADIRMVRPLSLAAVLEGFARGD